jgi:beta-N-acetylhexosaminidase
MVGLTCMKKPRDLLPAAIAAGCDMFLFFNDMDEDFGYMLDGYRNGVITQARLQEALERILGLKAKLGLHKKSPDQLVPPKEVMETVVGCAAHRAMAKEISDRAFSRCSTARMDPPQPRRWQSGWRTGAFPWKFIWTP